MGGKGLWEQESKIVLGHGNELCRVFSSGCLCHSAHVCDFFLFMFAKRGELCSQFLSPACNQQACQ